MKIQMFIINIFLFLHNLYLFVLHNLYMYKFHIYFLFFFYSYYYYSNMFFVLIVFFRILILNTMIILLQCIYKAKMYITVHLFYHLHFFLNTAIIQLINMMILKKNCWKLLFYNVKI